MCGRKVGLQGGRRERGCPGRGVGGRTASAPQTWAEDEKAAAALEDGFSLFFNLELMRFPAASAGCVVGVYPILSARPPSFMPPQLPPSPPNWIVCVNSLRLQKRGGYSHLHTFADVPHRRNVHAGTALLPVRYIRPSRRSVLLRLLVVFFTCHGEKEAFVGFYQLSAPGSD